MTVHDSIKWTLYCIRSPFVWCWLGTKGHRTCANPRKWNPNSDFAGADGTREGRLADGEARLACKEYRRKDTPVAIPTQRLRALTASLPSSPELSSEPSRSLDMWSTEHGSSSSRWMCAQELSPFFEKFPPEIRHQIYLLVFQGDAPIVRIVRRRDQRRLGHVRCQDSSAGPDGSDRWCGTCTGDRADELSRTFHRTCTDGSVLPLLRSCRKLYVEAIDTLYQSQTFEMLNPETLILFCMTVLPQRLNVVRRLQLTYNMERREVREHPGFFSEWNRACGFLSKMRALEELEVYINDLYTYIFTSVPNEEILGPLTAVTAVKKFLVRISWKLPDTLSLMEDGLPFWLVEWDPIGGTERVR